MLGMRLQCLYILSKQSTTELCTQLFFADFETRIHFIKQKDTNIGEISVIHTISITLALKYKFKFRVFVWDLHFSVSWTKCVDDYFSTLILTAFKLTLKPK